MSRHIVFADSEVASCTEAGGTLRVRFAVAHVTDVDDTTFRGQRPGHVPGVELVCRGGPWSAPQAGLAGRLAHGRLRVAGDWFHHLPLPHQQAGDLWLELRFANGAGIEGPLTALAITVPPEAAFSESFAC
jgi:hypothetical protein